MGKRSSSLHNAGFAWFPLFLDFVGNPPADASSSSSPTLPFPDRPSQKLWEGGIGVGTEEEGEEEEESGTRAGGADGKGITLFSKKCKRE